jgi:hypothetical protein
VRIAVEKRAPTPIPLEAWPERTAEIAQRISELGMRGFIGKGPAGMHAPLRSVSFESCGTLGQSERRRTLPLSEAPCQRAHLSGRAGEQRRSLDVDQYHGSIIRAQKKPQRWLGLTVRLVGGEGEERRRILLVSADAL